MCRRRISLGIERRTRRVSERLAITIPSHIAQLHDVNEGDFLAFTPTVCALFRMHGRHLLGIGMPAESKEKDHDFPGLAVASSGPTSPPSKGRSKKTASEAGGGGRRGDNGGAMTRSERCPFSAAG